MRRVHLQVERGDFHRVLLITGEPCQALRERVGDAKFHGVFSSYSLWLLLIYMLTSWRMKHGSSRGIGSVQCRITILFGTRSQVAMSSISRSTIERRTMLRLYCYIQLLRISAVHLVLL